MRTFTLTHGSSFRIWASSYVNAALEAMTDLVKRTLTSSASGVNSCGVDKKRQSHEHLIYGILSHTHITEKARRSTFGRKEQRLVPSRDGNMSIRLSTRYTVVPRAAASVSIGLSGKTKCDTSAIS